MDVFPHSYDWVAWLLLGLCAGCGSRSARSHDRYVPPPDQARATIATALQAWRRGEPVGTVQGSKPMIFVTDSYRRDGQTLEAFEILGEVPGHTQRTYLVKLSFANPKAEEKVRYAVVGIDPLWVYRHEDLELLAHWEHKMPAKPAEAQP